MKNLMHFYSELVQMKDNFMNKNIGDFHVGCETLIFLRFHVQLHYF